jgi:hypothetical protein
MTTINVACYRTVIVPSMAPIGPTAWAVAEAGAGGAAATGAGRQLRINASLMQRRVKETPVAEEWPIGSVTAEVLDGFYTQTPGRSPHSRQASRRRRQPVPDGPARRDPARRDVGQTRPVDAGAGAPVDVRRMRTQADPDDLDALQQPMLSMPSGAPAVTGLASASPR